MSGKNKIDVICPIFHVDVELFKVFIETWTRNIPIKYLMIGLGKKNDELEEFLLEYSRNVDYGIILFYQYNHKTLGYCIQELINAVTTEYFVYLHSDVEITLNWFDRMWESKVKGILESLKDPSFGVEALVQARKQRAYSGAQLMFTESVKNLNWEDRWIYCNEDLILKNIVLNRGYTYVKTPIYHKHYRALAKRTQPREIILEWQFKGIIKYCTPTHQLVNYIKGILKTLKNRYKKEFILEEEISAINSIWLPFL